MAEGWWGSRRFDIAVFAGIYVAAVLARLPIWHSAIYGDEGHAFMSGRTFGGQISNIQFLYYPEKATLAPLFWYRPLTHLPLAIGSAISFDAWRLNHLLLTSFGPAIAYGILRSLEVRRGLSVGAALALAFNPIFVSFGVIVFHDALGIVAFGLGLWAHVRGRHNLAAIGFVAAAWVEEVALFGLPFLFLYDVWQSVRQRQGSVWSMRFSSRQKVYLVAIVLSPAFLVISMMIGAPFPGHSDPSGFLRMVDHLLFLAWLLPLILLGLLWPRSREMAGLALVFPVFYVMYYATGHAVQVWWVLLPGFLSVLGAACSLEAWMRHRATRAPAGSSKASRFGVPHVVAALVAALVLIQVIVPSTAAWKADAVMPLSGESEWDLAETIAYQNSRDLALPDMVQHLNHTQLHEVFLVDVGWFFVFTPFAQVSAFARYSFTGISTDLPLYHRAIENSTAMVVYKGNTPLNHAILATYRECQVYENAEYVIVDTPHCAPRRAELEASYAALRAQP